MRICKKCGKEKPLEEFVRIKIWRKHTCKECYNAKFRTGKVNTGRFKKGQIPWIKGKKGVKKRTEPKYKKRPRKIGIEKQSKLYCEWMLNVIKRDEYKCQSCGVKEKLVAHHIVKWEDDESKRFDIKNGKTLCISCHCKLHRNEEISQGIFHLKGMKNK